MSNEYTVEIHRVYSSDAEKETLEVWRDNSINGQKVFTATGLGKNYQEVVSSVCMTENDYVFTLTSTYVLNCVFYVVKLLAGVKVLIYTLLLTISNI